MRNLGFAIVILAGLVNVDRIYYGGRMLGPAGDYLWRHVAHLFAA